MKTASVLFSIAIIILIASCNKKMTTDCGNGGTLRGGTCVCTQGFEGPDCGTISRNKFIGNWSQSGSGSLTIATQFPVSVQPAEAINSVSIVNFNNTFVNPINAFVSGADSLIIPAQQIDGKTVEGFCFYVANNNISVHYTIIDGTTGIVQTIDARW
jgi:hypothetical protein